MALKHEFIQEAGPNSTQLQALGDIYYTEALVPKSTYQKLVDEYNKERESGTSILNTVIDKLQKYTNSIDSEFIGLPKKLKDGGFEKDIDTAMLLKESYSMYLHENSFSIAKKKIHGYLLAKIYVAFNVFVIEAIRESKTNSEIKTILYNQVIIPIEQELGIDNVLELYGDDVLGMVYFLTGNCHISWK
jgi:hypothetical protein